MARKKNETNIMGQSDWFIHQDKPSYKWFRAGAYLATGGFLLWYGMMFVPFLANLAPLTMAWLKYFIYILFLGVPALSVVSEPKRWWRAFKSWIPALYEKLHKAEPQERLRMHIARYHEKVKVLRKMAEQLRSLYDKRNSMLNKYKGQIEAFKNEIARLKATIEKWELEPSKADRVTQKKRELLQVHQKANRLVKFTLEIKAEVEKLHKDLMTLEERYANENHQVELLEQDYQILIDRNKLGDQAVKARQEFEALSGDTGLGTKYATEMDIMEIIGDTEKKLASLDVVLESVSTTEGDDTMGYDLDLQLDMAENLGDEYLNQ